MVQDFAVVCIGLRLQLQPSQFWCYSTAVLYRLVIPSVVTLFYTMRAKLKEDCGEHVSPRLRIQQYFGQIKNNFFLKNELFIKDPEGVNPRSARPSASYTYLLYPNKRA